MLIQGRMLKKIIKEEIGRTAGRRILAEDTRGDALDSAQRAISGVLSAYPSATQAAIAGIDLLRNPNSDFSMSMAKYLNGPYGGSENINAVAKAVLAALMTQQIGVTGPVNRDFAGIITKLEMEDQGYDFDGSHIYDILSSPKVDMVMRAIARIREAINTDTSVADMGTEDYVSPDAPAAPVKRAARDWNDYIRMTPGVGAITPDQVRDAWTNYAVGNNKDPSYGGFVRWWKTWSAGKPASRTGIVDVLGVLNPHE